MKLSVRPPRFAERRPAPVILSSRGARPPHFFLRSSGRGYGPLPAAYPAPPHPLPRQYRRRCSGAEPGIESISHRPFCCGFRLRQCCRRLLRCGTRHRKHLPPSVLLRIPTPAMLSAVAPVRKPAPEILSAGRSCAVSDSGNSAARSSCGENGRRTRSAQGRFIPAARFRSPFVSGPCGKLRSDPRSALPGRERISNLNR